MGARVFFFGLYPDWGPWSHSSPKDQIPDLLALPAWDQIPDPLQKKGRRPAVCGCARPEAVAFFQRPRRARRWRLESPEHLVRLLEPDDGIKETTSELLHVTQLLTLPLDRPQERLLPLD